MVFTRILTLKELSTGSYYLYLFFYNLIYVIPLIVIVLLFSFTLGAKKLTERQGRVLKLLSGNMMLGLGSVLIINPNWLNHVGIAIALLIMALATTALIIWLTKLVRKPSSNS